MNADSEPDAGARALNLSPLDDLLGDRAADAYLIDASAAEADQLYLSGFSAPDPFLTLYDGDTHLLVSGLEYGRARSESRAESVDRHADHGYASGGREERLDAYRSFLAARDVDSVVVPERAPVGTADGLRERGVDVGIDTGDVLRGIRAVKTDAEVRHVRAAQRANEAAMAAAERELAGATVADGGEHPDGTLLAGGEPLTSEDVKETIEVELLGHGCALDETIVACGRDAADPHDRGSGPLSAGEPIVVDVFPRDEETKYHADMTRTFVVGEPHPALRERYDLTHEALDAALAAVEPGATGEAVHAAACEVYEAAGEPTLRSDPETETGFIHSTGHGVGLDVHELPRLSPSGGRLEPGHVVTVEPGLYDPAYGGVRIEELAVVTEDGHDLLSDYPIELVAG